MLMSESAGGVSIIGCDDIASGVVQPAEAYYYPPALRTMGRDGGSDLLQRIHGSERLS